MSTPTSTQQAQQAEQKTLVEFVSKAAETFASAYYAATDSPQRASLIPTLYLPSSSIVWNGTPISGREGLIHLINAMPGSKHELHAFDAHPLGGGAENGVKQPPSIMLTVSGITTHHTPNSLSAQAPTNAPRSARAGEGEGAPPLEALPRAFAQNFLLVHADNAEGGVNCQEEALGWAARYFVQADSFRFVG